MEKILYEDAIKAKYHTTNQEDSFYLDEKEERDIKCKIYQRDDSIIVFELPDKRKIELEIYLNLEELGDEQVILRYYNPKLPYIRNDNPKIIRRSSNPIE